MLVQLYGCRHDDFRLPYVLSYIVYCFAYAGELAVFVQLIILTLFSVAYFVQRARSPEQLGGYLIDSRHIDISFMSISGCKFNTISSGVWNEIKSKIAITSEGDKLTIKFVKNEHVSTKSESIKGTNQTVHTFDIVVERLGCVNHDIQMRRLIVREEMRIWQQSVRCYFVINIFNIKCMSEKIALYRFLSADQPGCICHRLATSAEACQLNRQHFICWLATVIGAPDITTTIAAALEKLGVVDSATKQYEHLVTTVEG